MHFYHRDQIVTVVRRIVIWRTKMFLCSAMDERYYVTFVCRLRFVKVVGSGVRRISFAGINLIKF